MFSKKGQGRKYCSDQGWYINPSSVGFQEEHFANLLNFKQSRIGTRGLFLFFILWAIVPLIWERNRSTLFSSVSLWVWFLVLPCLPAIPCMKDRKRHMPLLPAMHFSSSHWSAFFHRNISATKEKQRQRHQKTFFQGWNGVLSHGLETTCFCTRSDKTGWGGTQAGHQLIFFLFLFLLKRPGISFHISWSNEFI